MLLTLNTPSITVYYISPDTYFSPKSILKFLTNNGFGFDNTSSLHDKPSKYYLSNDYN